MFQFELVDNAVMQLTHDAASRSPRLVCHFLYMLRSSEVPTMRPALTQGEHNENQ
jgi:hypothetical protein